MSFTFSPEHETKIGELITSYPDIRALSLPMLWMAQSQEGYITKDAMSEIASRLSVSLSYVYSIASFYTMFKLTALGRYHIELCQTLSCALCGKDELLKHLIEKWGLTPGQTTADGRFSLSLVECMGACGGAPMIALNERYYENLTIESLDTLLESLP